jgi:hypothetical protein
MELAMWLDAALTMLAVGVVFSSQSLTDRVRIYDLVKYEVNQLVTRTSGTFKNTSGGTIAAGAVVVGQPVKLVGAQWVSVQAGDEANIKGLWLGDPATRPFVEGLANNAISALPGQILFNGPAVVDKNKIPTADLAAAGFTLATIVTALAALGIQVLAEPTTSAQQTK